ncbi:hypothetical protein P3S68_018417 [Capsicum galapagoense]
MDYYYATPLALFLAWTLAQGFTLLLALTTNRSRRKLPPGPSPLPIIGNLHLLGNQPHRSLAKLADFHGPIMRLKLGQTTAVVISSSDMAKQVLQKQGSAFSNRPVPNSVHVDNYHVSSVVWLPASRPQWKNLRKILNNYIFSVSKLDASQHFRYKKIEELVVYCQRSSQMGEAVDIGGTIFRTLLNLLSNILFSKDLADPYENSGKEFKELVEGLLRLELRKSQNDQKTDIIEALITASEQSPQEIDVKNIPSICVDVFVAGTDTSSNVMEWAMAEILKAPEVMKKAQVELAEVIREGKAIEEADILRLPYLQCIIKETYRLHPPAPFLVPREAGEDVEVCGYTVPKGSKLMVNVWAIGRDSTLWEDPLVFNPDRFMDSKMDVRGQDFELIPFGAG